MLESLRQDLEYALRGMRRSPGLTAVIAVTFALGVGVNAAVFTVSDRILFRSPPGLVDPAAVRRLIVQDKGWEDRTYTRAVFGTEDLKQFAELLGGMGAVEGYERAEGRTVDDAQPTISVGYATTGFFEFAGVRPYRGRFFTADENEYGAPRHVLILGHDFWRARFGADPQVLGKTVRVDSVDFTVVGIAPPGFEGLDADGVAAWAPLASRPPGYEGTWWLDNAPVAQLFVRQPAARSWEAIADRLTLSYRERRRSRTAVVLTAPVLEARSSLRLGSSSDRALGLLMRLIGIGLVILIIASSNVASLLLMRAVKRRREMAVRTALGASRGRIACQLLVESLVIAAIGGGAALVTAWWAGALLRRQLFGTLHWPDAVIDLRVVGVVASLTVFAGMVAALAPISVAFRRDLMDGLRAGAGTGRQRSAIRIVLLVAQSALCLAMLSAAAMFVSSLRRATAIDPGFDATRLITFSLARTSPDVKSAILDRVRALRGVAAVSQSDMSLWGGAGATIFFANGDSVRALQSPLHGYVDPSYATTAGLRLLRGRFIDADDRKGSEPVAVINQAMADAYWPGKNPIGECFIIIRPTDPCRRIVGVVQSVRWRLTEPPVKAFYLPQAHSPWASAGSSIIVRTAGVASPTLAAEIRAITRQYATDAQNPPDPQVVAERLAPQMRPWRIAAGLFVVFGVLALAAAGAGIYGLTAYDVAQRTHELGVRLTLGATRASILALVVTSSARIITFGVIAGVGLAMGGGQLMRSLLFETSAFEPLMLGGASAVLVVAATIAALIPAVRATRVDPMEALRAE